MKNYYQKQKSYWRKLIPLIALPVATIFSVFSAKAQTYCTITYPQGCGSWGVYGTNSVTIGSFQSSPVGCGPNNFVSQVVNLNAGVSTPVSLVTHGWTSAGIAADFNNDGDFEDAGEVLGLPAYVGVNGDYTYNFNITVPPYVVTGNYRLRVWTRAANGGGANDGVVPCGTFGYGNYTDYTLAVTNGATCLPPAGVTVAPASNTAALSWTAATTTPLSYDWKVVANGGNPATSTGVASGNATGTSASATGLAASTTYQLYVRSACTSATDTSVWTLGTTFTTLCGGAPAGGSAGTSVSPVCPTTSFTLTLTGNTTGPGISYQWQSSPAGAGTFTNISGATAATYTGTQSSSKDYRCYLVCSGSGLSDTSVLINVAQSPANTCYCIPTVSTSTASYYIASFSTTNGATNITNNSSGAGGAYTNYSATMSASAIQGNTVNFSWSGKQQHQPEARHVYRLEPGW